MKYDCSDEFDLNEIFRKLTGETNENIAAKDFFAPKLTLAAFQQAMDRLICR